MRSCDRPPEAASLLRVRLGVPRRYYRPISREVAKLAEALSQLRAASAELVDVDPCYYPLASEDT
jgi:hypothetical protein